MADLIEYEVLRQHDGDRQYWQGDTRKMLASDAAHLVKLGVLRPMTDGAEKAEAAPANKAEKAPKNKAVKHGD